MVLAVPLLFTFCKVVFTLCHNYHDIRHATQGGKSNKLMAMVVMGEAAPYSGVSCSSGCNVLTIRMDKKKKKIHLTMHVRESYPASSYLNAFSASVFTSRSHVHIK